MKIIIPIFLIILFISLFLYVLERIIKRNSIKITPINKKYGVSNKSQTPIKL